jgi:hypothetical protein
MMRSLDRVCLAGCVVWAAAAGGCQAAVPATREPAAAIDPCAGRLHDACEPLLLYCAANGRLPETLEELKRIGSGSLPPLVCPISNKPYIYNREGLRVPGRAGRLVLYDAEPVHSGMRWGILAEATAEGKPLSARVIPVAEKPVFSAGK